MDVGVQCGERDHQRVHHVFDLMSVTLVGQTPGQGEEPEGRKLPKDGDDLRQVHAALPDAERHGEPLESVQPGELQHLAWRETAVSQHGLGLDLQKYDLISII